MKKLLCTLLTVALLLSLLSLPAFAEPTGTGTEQDPYTVASIDDLARIFDQYDPKGFPFEESVFFKLNDDITINGSNNFSVFPVLWKNLSIDLNGHTLTYAGATLFTFGKFEVNFSGELVTFENIPDSITVKNGTLVSESEGYSSTYDEMNYLYQPAGMSPENDLSSCVYFAGYSGLNANITAAQSQLANVQTQFIFEDLSMDYDAPVLSYFPSADILFENVDSNSFSLITNGDVKVRDCTLRSAESMHTDAVIHCLGGILNVVNSTLVGNNAAALLANANATFNRVSLSSNYQVLTAVVLPYGYKIVPNRPSYPNTYTLDGTEYYDNGSDDYYIYQGTSYVSPQGPTGENQNSQTTNVTYTIEESGQFSPTYIVSIPAQVRLNQNFMINVEELILEESDALVVTLDDATSNQQGFALFGTGNNANNSINYTVKCLENTRLEPTWEPNWSEAETKNIGDRVLYAYGPCDTSEGSEIQGTAMRFELVEDLSYVPGDYEGYVTFGIALE